MRDTCDQNNEIRALETERILNTINKKFFSIGEPTSACNILLMRRCFMDVDEFMIKAELIATSESAIKEKFLEELGAHLGGCLMDFSFVLFCLHSNENKPDIDGLVEWSNINKKYTNYFTNEVLEVCRTTSKIN